METMSFCIGIDHFIYCNNSVSRKNDNSKETTTTEIDNSKQYDEGEKK